MSMVTFFEMIVDVIQKDEFKDFFWGCFKIVQIGDIKFMICYLKDMQILFCCLTI